MVHSSINNSIVSEALRTSVLGLLILISGVGCASTHTSNTSRTAKEQLLLSNAIDQSLDKVDFTPLYGQKVFVNESYLDCTDKPYVVGSIRHRVMRAGGLLVDSAETADIVLETRSGGVGTDMSESFVGLPEITLPGMLTLPEIRLAEKKTQFGYSKLGLVLFDASSREVLGDGGMAMAQADDNNWFVFGVGPIQNGTLKGELSKTQMVPPGTHLRSLPTIVAFGTPVPSADTSEPQIQYAAGQDTSPE